MELTTASKITIARILMVPLFVLELLEYIDSGQELHRWLAVAVFGVVAIGDGLDGYVARRYNQRSEMGALLDPLADKLLLVLGLVVLSMDNRPRLDRIPLWLTATVLSRDVALLVLMVLVNYLVGRGTVRPHITGKAATVLQMVCVLWALAKGDPDWLFVWAVGAAACTAISGLLYIRDGIGMLRSKPISPLAPETCSSPADKAQAEVESQARTEVLRGGEKPNADRSATEPPPVTSYESP